MAPVGRARMIGLRARVGGASVAWLNPRDASEPMWAMLPCCQLANWAASHLPHFLPRGFFSLFFSLFFSFSK